jgi:hypothetical protein
VTATRLHGTVMGAHVTLWHFQITDYADERKDKVFQPYGARLAALYFLELMGIYLDTLDTVN